MTVHYNAFISYRHHPEDMKVADQIHKALEHYKLPHSLKKSTGGIQRLFRDKEELPITSNLSDDIDQALKNSDFLIVICSTHTGESVWVQREINLFLTTHDRNHVLTVLVNGEPYEVIPPCLLTEQVVDPVTGEIREVALEPLSCDWRSANKKVRAQELARLAAPLLGCSYDGLRQRQKHYQTKRRMAAASVALGISLCFTGYFLYSNHLLEDANLQLQSANDQLENANVEIRNNLDQALINQSVFLASEAQELLKSGDRMSALALSLEALPEYPGERPYVTQAEEALTQASAVYELEEDLRAVTAFQTDFDLSDIAVSPDGKVLYALDRSRILYAWDTDSFSLLGTLPKEETSSTFIPTEKGNLLIFDTTRHIAACYDPHLHALWKQDLQGEMAFIRDSQTLIHLQPSQDTQEGSMFLPRECSLFFLDADTGLPAREPVALPMDKALTYSPFFISQQYDSIRSLVFRCRKDEQDRIRLFYLDPDSFVFRRIPVHPTSVTLSTEGLDGSLLLLSTRDTSFENGIVYDAITTSPEESQLTCLDPKTMGILWETALDSDFYSIADTVERIPDTGEFYCLKGNLAAVIDGKSGKILSHADLPGTPLTTTLLPDSSIIILDNGSRSHFHFKESYSLTVPFTDAQLTRSCINRGIYSFSNLDNKVYLYGILSNEEAAAYKRDTPALRVSAVSGSRIAGASDGELYLFDAEKRDYDRTYALENHRSDRLFFSRDGKAVWSYDSFRSCLIRFGTETQRRELIELPHELSGNHIFYSNRFYTAEDTFLCLCTYRGEDLDLQPGLLKYSLEAGEFTLIPMPRMEKKSDRLLMAGDSRHALVFDQGTREIFEVDLNAGTAAPIASSEGSSAYASILEDGSYCLSYDGQAQLRHFGGDAFLTLPLRADAAVSACLHDGELLLLLNDALLCRYDPEGTLTAAEKATVYDTFLYNLSQDRQGIRWDFTEDDRLVLTTFSCATIFNGSDLKKAAFVPNVLSYLPRQDGFVLKSRSYDRHQLYALRRYSPQELVTYARNQLGSITLTPEQRESYGLS